MAKDKNSFILYTDLIGTVSKLPDDKAGQLFKIILGYVNDLNPQVDDILLQVAFEPVKQQLKRDLKKWEGEKVSRSEAGRVGGQRSGEARRSKTKQNEATLQFASKNEANEAVTVTVSVTDTVTERENTDFNKKNTQKKIADPLTEIETAACREFFSITLHREYQPERIVDMWKAFCIQHEETYHPNRNEAIKHFRNWIKTQPYDADKRITETGTRKTGGKSTGAEQLAGLLKDELTSFQHPGG